MSCSRGIPLLSYHSLSHAEVRKGFFNSFFSNALNLAKEKVHKEIIDVFPLTVLSKNPLHHGAIPFVYALFTRVQHNKYTPKPNGIDSKTGAVQKYDPADAFANINDEAIIASIETWKYAPKKSSSSSFSFLQSPPSGASRHHVLLYNKYPVIPEHIVIVSDGPFLSQYDFLDLPDMIALWTCVVSMDGLGFYNAGDKSGASQPRRHVQFVPNSALVDFLPAPLPQNSNQNNFPIYSPLDRAISTYLLAFEAKDDEISEHVEASTQDALLPLKCEQYKQDIKDGEPFSLPYLPYKHGIVVLPTDLSTNYPNKEAAEYLYGKYKEVCEFLEITRKNGEGFDTTNGTDTLFSVFHEFSELNKDERLAFNDARLTKARNNNQDSHCQSHNLLLTKNYIFVVPRRIGDRKNVCINSLGFAGYLIGREFDYDFVTPQTMLDASATNELQSISTPVEALREINNWTRVAKEVLASHGEALGPLSLLLHCGLPPTAAT